MKPRWKILVELGIAVFAMLIGSHLLITGDEWGAWWAARILVGVLIMIAGINSAQKHWDEL